MDGTLVDTEPYWIAAEHELVAAHGGEWNDEFAHQLVGNALEVSAQLIIDKSGIGLTVPEIIDALLDRVVRHVEIEVPWRPGARELLDELGALGVPCLLVTMSWRRLADTVVRNLPDGSFTALVTGDEVGHGKPHPEPYLAAASLIGAEPDRLRGPRGLAGGRALGHGGRRADAGDPARRAGARRSTGRCRSRPSTGVRAADLLPLTAAGALVR